MPSELIALSPISFIFGLFFWFSPFSLFFLYIHLLVLGGLYWFPNKQAGIKRIQRVLAILALGLVGLWISLLASTSPVPAPAEAPAIHTVALGGFPFPAFHYPTPPGGNDVPPAAQWPLFYANEAIWLLFASLVWIHLPARIREHRGLRTTLFLLAVYLTFTGFGFLMLKFD